MATPAALAGDRATRIWLGWMCWLVAAMVVIGGITRLTESGLSMAEWRPLIGWIPPLSSAEWERVFALYRETPEFQDLNSWMTIDDFRTIFWWEYIHRVWGRLLGVAFAVPFVVLLVMGKIRRSLLPRLVLLFVLGGVQGGIGWWMVKSGLVDDPAVSQYRLAVHLSMALVIFCLLLWTVLDLLPSRADEKPVASGLRGPMVAVMALVSLTIVAGAFVAGINAGLIYNSFPFMGDGLVPPEYGAVTPWWRDAFENHASVQFHHRVIAIVTALVVLAVAHAAMRQDKQSGGSRAVLFGRLTPWAAMSLAVGLQVGLGIATLLAHVPVWLGAAHQAGAVLLLAAVVWALHTSYRRA